MSLHDRSLEFVDALLDRLAEQYGRFEQVEKTWKHPQEQYETFVQRFEAGAVGGAGIWITNEQGEVLLARNEGDEGWADPGGKVEADETYETAAKREVREETGADCRITGLCEVHVIENRNVEGNDPPLYSPIVVFHGEYVSGDIQPRDGEIADVDWFDSPPETVLYEEVCKRPYPAQQQ